MPKEEKAEVKLEVEPEPIVEEKPPTKEEIEEARSQAQKFEQNWKDSQRVISKKDEEIQTLKDNQELWKAMIAAVAEQKGISEEAAEADIKQRQPNLAQQFDQKMTQLEQKRFNDRYLSYKDVVEELGLKPTDEDYDVIESLARTGKWDKADKKIEALKAKPQETPEKKETEDEMVNKRLKEELEKRGLLTSETGEPSAAGGITMEEFRKLPPEERVKRLPEIRKTMEGK